MISLMSLPGEIRNQIYDLVIFPRYPGVQIHASHPKDLCRTSLKSPLFRTCRTIRFELLARFCKSKILVFLDYESYKVFLKYVSKVGDGNIAERNIEEIAVMVKHLTLVKGKSVVNQIEGLDMIDAAEAFNELGTLKKVTLVVRFERPSWGSGPRMLGTSPNTVLERHDGKVLSPGICSLTGQSQRAIFGVVKAS